MSQYENDGTWKCICPVCGQTKYSDQMKRRWDGVMVCEKDWEIRHPMELYKPKVEDSKLPFAYPDVPHPEVDNSGWVGIGETDPWGGPV